MQSQRLQKPEFYGTNHPQLKQPTRVTRVSHVCDTHTPKTKTHMAQQHTCARVQHPNHACSIQAMRVQLNAVKQKCNTHAYITSSTKPTSGSYLHTQVWSYNIQYAWSFLLGETVAAGCIGKTAPGGVQQLFVSTTGIQQPSTIHYKIILIFIDYIHWFSFQVRGRGLDTITEDRMSPQREFLGA